MNWNVAVEKEATGSDLEAFVCEVLGGRTEGSETRTETTGWDIRNWDPTWKSGRDREW